MEWGGGRGGCNRSPAEGGGGGIEEWSEHLFSLPPMLFLV